MTSSYSKFERRLTYFIHHSSFLPLSNVRVFVTVLVLYFDICNFAPGATQHSVSSRCLVGGIGAIGTVSVTKFVTFFICTFISHVGLKQSRCWLHQMSNSDHFECHSNFWPKAFWPDLECQEFGRISVSYSISCGRCKTGLK